MIQTGGLTVETLEAELRDQHSRFHQFENQTKSDIHSLYHEIKKLAKLYENLTNDAGKTGLPPASSQTPQTPSEFSGKPSSRPQAPSGVTMAARSIASSESTTGEAHGEVRIDASIWEVPLLAGQPMVGAAGSAWLLLLLFINILVQSAFTYIVYDSMWRPDIDAASVEGFRTWRRAVAHDLKYVTGLEQQSLAVRVCAGDRSLETSVTERDTHLALQDYLHAGLGPLMCILGLLRFVLLVSKECTTIASILWALYMLPRGHSRWTCNEYGAVKIEQLSILRSSLFLIIMAVRAVILIALTYYGCLYLVFTVEMGGFLVNVTVLQLILNMDTLIFGSLAPTHVKTIVKYSQSLAVLTWSKWYGLDCHAVATLTMSMATVGFFAWYHLGPFVGTIVDARDALCGGVDDSSFDFVLAVDSIGIPWAAKTPRSQSRAAIYARDAISEVIKLGFPRAAVPLTGRQRSNLGLFIEVATASNLHNYVSSSDAFGHPHEWKMVNPSEMPNITGWDEKSVLTGVDFGDGPGTVYNAYLKHLLGLPNEASCADVPLEECYDIGEMGLRLRKLCAKRCGCLSPTTGTVSSGSSTLTIGGFPGCSPWAMRTKKFSEDLENLPCWDTNNSNILIHWSQGIGNALGQSGGLIADQVVASFESGGCQAVASVLLGPGISICDETSLPAICPSSCGCDESQSWSPRHAKTLNYCPHSCGRLQPICFTIAVNHTVETGTSGPFVDFPCIFPFKWRNKTYNNCTIDAWTVPWCAVTLQSGYSYHWGDCPPGC